MSATIAPSTDRTEQPDRPLLKRIRARSTWQGSMRTHHRVRSFEFDTGEPDAVGGDNSAPTPMEYVVAALGGCLAVVVETVATEQQLRLDSLEIETAATMDRRGILGTADVSPHFQHVVLRARFGLEDIDALPLLQAEVERRCPAVNLVKDAGVPVVLDWSVTEVTR